MHTSNWQSELYKLLLWLAVALAVGWPFGLIPWALAIAAGAFCLRSIYNLHKLHRWLTTRSASEPPEATGLWGEVLDGLYRLQQKDRRDALQVRVRALSKERDAVLAKDAPADGFDEKVVGALKEQARQQGIAY